MTEIEQLTHEREKVTVLQGRIAALTRERDEATSQAARYRAALEDYIEAHNSAYPTPKDMDEHIQAQEDAALAVLAESPAASLEAVRAEAAENAQPVLLEELEVLTAAVLRRARACRAGVGRA